jgi:hypothetical protein
MQSDYDDTKAVARLPNLDIEIVHRRPLRGDEEVLTVTLRATPSFDAFFGFLDSASPAALFNPAALWMRAFETAWSPWLKRADPTRRLSGPK